MTLAPEEASLENQVNTLCINKGCYEDVDTARMGICSIITLITILYDIVINACDHVRIIRNWWLVECEHV